MTETLTLTLADIGELRLLKRSFCRCAEVRCCDPHRR